MKNDSRWEGAHVLKSRVEGYNLSECVITDRQRAPELREVADLHTGRQ